MHEFKTHRNLFVKSCLKKSGFSEKLPLIQYEHHVNPRTCKCCKRSGRALSFTFETMNHHVRNEEMIVKNLKTRERIVTCTLYMSPVILMAEHCGITSM